MRVPAHLRVPLLRATALAAPAGLAVSLAPFTVYRLRSGAVACASGSGLRLSGELCSGATRSAWHGGGDPPFVIMLVLAGLFGALAAGSSRLRLAVTLAAGASAASAAILGAAAIGNPPPGSFEITVRGGGPLAAQVPDAYLSVTRGWGFWLALVLCWLCIVAVLGSLAAGLARPDVPAPAGVPGWPPGPAGVPGWPPGPEGWTGWMPSGPGLGPPPRSYPPPR